MSDHMEPAAEFDAALERFLAGEDLQKVIVGLSPEVALSCELFAAVRMAVFEPARPEFQAALRAKILASVGGHAQVGGKAVRIASFVSATFLLGSAINPALAKALIDSVSRTIGVEAAQVVEQVISSTVEFRLPTDSDEVPAENEVASISPHRTAAQAGSQPEPASYLAPTDLFDPPAPGAPVQAAAPVTEHSLPGAVAAPESSTNDGGDAPPGDSPSDFGGANEGSAPATVVLPVPPALPAIPATEPTTDVQSPAGGDATVSPATQPGNGDLGAGALPPGAQGASVTPEREAPAAGEPGSDSEAVPGQSSELGEPSSPEAPAIAARINGPVARGPFEDPPWQANGLAKEPPGEANGLAKEPPWQANGLAKDPPWQANGLAKDPPWQANGLAKDPPGQANGLAKDPPAQANGLAKDPPGQANGPVEDPPGQANGLAEEPPGEANGLAKDPPGEANGLAKEPPGEAKAASDPAPGPPARDGDDGHGGGPAEQSNPAKASVAESDIPPKGERMPEGALDGSSADPAGRAEPPGQAKAAEAASDSAGGSATNKGPSNT